MVKRFVRTMLAILLLDLITLNIASNATASSSGYGLAPEAAIDSHIESGFPVQTYNQGSGTWWDESPSTVIANLDNDETLEISSAGFSSPSLYVMNRGLRFMMKTAIPCLAGLLTTIIHQNPCTRQPLPIWTATSSLKSSYLSIQPDRAHVLEMLRRIAV